MPRKTVRQQKSKRNRVAGLVKKLIGTESADDIMLELRNILTETRDPPRAGAFYIFVYNAKTPNTKYDRNPLVAVTNVYTWGFRGFNYHWGEERSYTWDEIASRMYEVYQEELSDLRRLPFGNIRLNS
jgi:hypothetical protein